MNIDTICVNYNSRNFEALAQELDDADQRIEFERWLGNRFSPQEALDSDFAWHSRVIALLCSKTGADAGSSVEERNREDLLIARLISKSDPSLKKEPGILQRIAWVVHHSAGMTLNFSQISAGIKEAIALPSTCNVLLKRLLKSQDIKTIFWQSVQEGNLSMIKAIAHQAPRQFPALLTMRDSKGNNPVQAAIARSNEPLLKFMRETAREEFQEALCSRDREGSPSLVYAVDDPHLMEMLAEDIAAFKKVLIVPDKDGNTAVAIAVQGQHLNTVKYMDERAPKSVQTALTMQNKKGETPVIQAANLNDVEMLTWMHQTFTNTFKEALFLQDKAGETALHVAARHENMEMLKLMANSAPEALLLRNNAGESVMSLLKSRRPHDYREITQRFKKHPEAMGFYKTWLAHKALGHVFHLKGYIKVANIRDESSKTFMKLEGHESPQWHHLMLKHFDAFNAVYPQLLSDEFKSLMKQLFDLGANPHSYSLEDKLDRIKAGLPVMCNTGYQGHAVNIMIWGNQFALCNRGASSRRPIEIYHFDPQQFELEDLKKIEEFKKLTSREYKQLLFETLPQKLHFAQTDLDHVLEQSEPLPRQTVGNCSFVSPATATYAFLLLGFAHGVDEQGNLKAAAPDKKESEQAAQEALSAYQTWLVYEQLQALEISLKPLETRQSIYEVDHGVIVEALRKAHLLPLDKPSREKLNALTQIYINSLDPPDDTQMKADLAYWRTLAKVPLL
jgi:ankyrin repeat protein